MSVVNTLDSYFITNCRLATAIPLHDLTARFRDQLLTDRALQNLLLNSGQEIDDARRPTSFFNITNGVILRDKTAILLEHLLFAIDKTTNPYTTELAFLDLAVPVQAMLVSHTGVAEPAYLFAPASVMCQLVTERPDVAQTEELQSAWFSQPGLSETVRAYERSLLAAFGDFNLQLALGAASNARGARVEQGSQEYALQEEIRSAFNKRACTALDTAYYNSARRHLIAAERHSVSLRKMPHGLLFIVPDEESG